jgi:hypothetical protein
LGRSGGHAGFCDYVMRPPLLDLVAESLSRAASTRKEDQPHVRAFVLWMELDTASARLGFGELTSTRTAPDAPTSAAAVAALGFSAATADPDPNITNRFAEELEWLRGRQFFVPHRPRGFEADGTALLGVALGIASLSRAEIDREAARDWLFGLLTRALAETPRTSWHHDLMLVAELVLRGTGGSTMISSDLKVALASKGLQTASDIDESQALDIILSLSHRADGPTRAATQMRALYWLLRSRPTLGVAHPTEDEVVRLLGRVEHSMRRWAWDEKSRTRSGGTAKWDILHEYHVQDLLWTILAPLFPDLEDEENLPSLGHKHPRADLGIPALTSSSRSSSCMAAPLPSLPRLSARSLRIPAYTSRAIAHTRRSLHLSGTTRPMASNTLSFGKG